MTGGGRARRGGMGTEVTAGLVREKQNDNTPQMKKSIEEYERRVAKLIPSIAVLERQEDKLKQKMYTLEDEYKRLSIDIQVGGSTNAMFNIANSSCFSAFDEKCASFGRQAEKTKGRCCQECF